MTPVTSAGKAGVRERIPDKSWLSNRFEAQSGGLGQGQGQGDDCADLQDLELKEVESAPSNMVGAYLQ